jgi:hypothetical protein
MTDLSLAAQAVLDAAIKVAESPDAEAIAAAALRAAVEQSTYQDAWDSQFTSAEKILAIADELETSTAENYITFVAPATEEVMRPATEEVMRIDKEGFHYRGQFIADAGEAHRLMLEFLKQNTQAALAQPEPQRPSLMDIIALADEVEEEGLGQVALVRRALVRWGYH